jgi:hypothetical protein
MTMPKKGTRKIVIDGEVYRFRVKTYDDDYGSFDRNEVVIEKSDGTVFQDSTREEAVTPFIVESMILAALEGAFDE